MRLTDTLTPAERLALVLHDTFAVPFEEIAAMMGRTPAAARQLASRARRRVRGAAIPRGDLSRQREVADAFLLAARGGDFEALLAVLDPDVVLRADTGGDPVVTSRTVRGAEAVAQQAFAFSERGRYAHPVLVNGVPGLLVRFQGRPQVVMGFTVVGGKIV